MATFISILSVLPTPVLSAVVILATLLCGATQLVRCCLLIQAGRIALNPADPGSGKRAQRVLESQMSPRSFGRRR